MRKTLTLVGLLEIGILSSGAVSWSTAALLAQQQDATMKVCTLKVTGMTCAGGPQR